MGLTPEECCPREERVESEQGDCVIRERQRDDVRQRPVLVERKVVGSRQSDGSDTSHCMHDENSYVEGAIVCVGECVSASPRLSPTMPVPVLFRLILNEKSHCIAHRQLRCLVPDSKTHLRQAPPPCIRRHSPRSGYAHLVNMNQLPART